MEGRRVIYLYIYSLHCCAPAAVEAASMIWVYLLLVRTDHVAASPVEWKHIETLICFLILLEIFIRFHRTLKKVSSIHSCILYLYDGCGYYFIVVFPLFYFSHKYISIYSCFLDGWILYILMLAKSGDSIWISIHVCLILAKRKRKGCWKCSRFQWQ